MDIDDPSQRYKKHEPVSFKTPEQVAEERPSRADEDPLESNNFPSSKEREHGLSSKKKHGNKIVAWFTNLDPRRKTVVIFVAVVVLAGIVTGLVFAFHSKPKVVANNAPKAQTTKKAPPAPTTVSSTLSGLSVTPDVNNRPVTAVMIENSDFARPQSGLLNASIVFEALAEGGVTRFMALYQDTQPSYIGPVRSARPYYIQWAMGFDAAYAHVGGSPDALSDISAWGVKDLDEFYNSSYYQRIPSRDAPHNVYTSIAQLNALEQAKGYGAPKYVGFPRKSESPSKSPNATTINLNIISYDFNVKYVYNAATNSYNRFLAGAPHTDQQTGQQLSPKVVVAMVVPWTQGTLDATGAYYSDYATLGSGQVDIFQDGTVTQGTWSKVSNASQITFTDANNNPIKLDAGQTWITVLGAASDIVYQ